MQKSPADDFSVGRGCDFVPPRSFAEGLDPVGDFLLRDGGGEALAFLASRRCRRAPRACAPLSPMPLLAEVQKGMTVLPVKSLALTNVSTGHAAMPHQIG